MIYFAGPNYPAIQFINHLKDIIGAKSGEMTAQECTSSTNSSGSARSSKGTRCDKIVKEAGCSEESLMQKRKQ